MKNNCEVSTPNRSICFLLVSSRGRNVMFVVSNKRCGKNDWLSGCEEKSDGVRAL